MHGHPDDARHVAVCADCQAREGLMALDVDLGPGLDRRRRRGLGATGRAGRAAGGAAARLAGAGARAGDDAVARPLLDPGQRGHPRRPASLATDSTGTPWVALLAPALAGIGVAYAYGPGIDPAFELGRTMPISDRMILLVRCLAVCGTDALLGLVASLVAGQALGLTLGWLLPMTAVSALALAAATLARSANVGVAAALAGWAVVILGSAAAAPAACAISARRSRSNLGCWCRSTAGDGGLPGARALGDERTPHGRDPMAVATSNGSRAAGATATGMHVQGLVQRFGRTEALARVDLAIGPGVFGLLGPNGAGKTTLLRTLATIIGPSEGSLRLLGFDPSDPGERRALRRRLGYLPQSLGYHPNFTVFEFVEYFALLKEMPANAVRPAVARAIERVGLEERARSKLKTLSGGMLRRVGIAQAIVNEPDLLLLDEPTAGLDPEQRVLFRALLREIGERGVVIVSTHLVEDVAAATTEVALMDRGRIVFRGTPDRLTALGIGDGQGLGDSALERGYSRVLQEARS